MWEKLETQIENLFVIHPFISEDNRGNFVKVYEKNIFSSLDIPNDISEVFISTSKPNVIRGMHFQYHNPQSKYITVLKGRIFDVAVDLRIGSPTFGKWHAEELSEENHKIYCIPSGFAHGFQVVGNEDATVMYQCCGKYDKESDSGIVWNDPDIKIDWPLKDNCIISERDSKQMTFDTFKKTIKGL